MLSYIEENRSYKQATDGQPQKRAPQYGEAPQEMMQYWGT